MGSNRISTRHTKITTPTAETIAREQYVLELRRAGAPFDEIADKIQCGDRSNAYKIYKRAMARTLLEPAADIRALEGDRLDRLQLAAWSKATVKGDLAAIHTVLRVMERRAKLFGLDHADGIAERSLQLEAEKIKLMALAFGRALDSIELTPEQREQLTRVFLTELRAQAEAGAATDPDVGEPVELEQGDPS